MTLVFDVANIPHDKNDVKVEHFARAKPTSLTDKVDYFPRDENTGIEMLNRYPEMKAVFIKYRTTQCSS